MKIEEIGNATLINADCRDAMRAMDENSIDAVVCDPPYGLTQGNRKVPPPHNPDSPFSRCRMGVNGDTLAVPKQSTAGGFMGMGWDHGVPGTEFWIEALRVAKPGAHLLAFGGTRTFHRLMAAIEDAGWEIRDTIMWVYGSGFPKSLDVSKAIDKAAGVEREVVGSKLGQPGYSLTNGLPGGVAMEGNVDGSLRNGAAECAITAPATEAAKQWEGWGTALKPAWEPVIVARKPLTGTVAANVLEHGTGALNIDGCRVEGRERTEYGLATAQRSQGATYGEPSASADFDSSKGRWPANLIHDGSDDVLALFPDSNGSGGSLPNVKITGYGDGAVGTGKSEYFGGPRMKVNAGSGSAARFFYCAKTSKKDRNEGLDDEPDKVLARSCQAAAAEAARGNTVETEGGAFNKARVVKNNHPCVKPTELMRYLCRLVTPPSGTVLDPFMGSGSTGKAALLEGFSFVGIDNDEEHGYFDIAMARIKAATMV